MLVELELPGFPPPPRRPICLGCTAEVPTGVTHNNRTTYTPQELVAWEATVPECGAPDEAVFPDPRGLEVDHDEGCEYEGIPPVALWQRDIKIANAAWLKVREAKRRRI
ncbi:hypothetical protein K4B79_10690 [Streptomyces lincolnensis]|uniref:hypothetical protein n=1 Tax=Streptomyces lincolnensis TaxID=1915 RepID=UPI001E30BE59|nr:hypothetical protein [Streptomyces lincolnensis]MCD7438687.1 hypothetical protein [Streptomyces lincolnensis]